MPDSTFDLDVAIYGKPQDDGGKQPDGGANEGPSNKPADGTPEPSTEFSGFDTIDPIAAHADTGTGVTGEPRKRGRHLRDCSCDRCTARRNGTDGGTKGAAKSNDLVVNLERLLISVHAMGAKILAFDELELDAGEAKELADAVKAYAQFKTPKFLSPEKMALGVLLSAIVSVYGTRVAVAIKKSREKPRLVREKITPIDRGTERSTTAEPNTAPSDLSKVPPSALFDFAPQESNSY